MTQYILHVMSYDGLVPGASHYRARVEGPHPSPCHGTSSHHRDGGVFCVEGHPLPGQVRWDVEKDWSRERMDRYLAACSKALRTDAPSPDGPGQFDSKEEVLDRAMVQFLDGMDGVNAPAEQGDELWYGWVCPDGPGAWTEEQDASDGWGMRIALCNRG